MMVGGGMGPPLPGRIPWTAIDAYARRYDIGGEDFERLVRIIRTMDDVLLSHSTKGTGK